MATLTEAIEQRLLTDVGLYIAVEEDGQRIVLSGLIDSDGLREDVHAIVAEMAPGRRIDDNLAVMNELPADVEANGLEAGDFTDARIETNPLAPMGPSYEDLDGDVASEGGDVYVPPVDPTGPQADMISGFAMTSMDEIDVDRSVSDGTLSDDAIREAIMRELAEDAATTDLDIRVSVRSGCASLRGSVPTVDDAENAEEVAWRVPGVVDVLEALDVQLGAGREG